MGLGVRARGSPGRLLHRMPDGVAMSAQPSSHHEIMSEITIHELEAAINFWRARSPSSGDELVLCKEASALSKPYALMIVQRQTALTPEGLDATAREAWNSYVRLKNGL
jgi:hypothetical protein